MNGIIAAILEVVRKVGKRVVVNRNHKTHQWGILGPSDDIQGIMKNPRLFKENLDTVTLRDVTFHCKMTSPGAGCAGANYVGVAEGTIEVETPPSDRQKVPIEFSRHDGFFYRADQLKKVESVKRLYLSSNGQAHAEILE